MLMVTISKQLKVAESICNQGRDIAIDVAIVNLQSDGTNAELQQLALAKGIAARRKGRED